MSYLTRLSQQTGLALATPQVQPAESPQSGFRQVEEFVAPAPDLNRTVEPPTLSTNSPPTPAAPSPEPSPSGLQPPPQESAAWDFLQPAAPFQPGPEPSQQELSAPKLPQPADWRVMDSGVTVPSASPETRADSTQPSVRLPERTVERSQAPAPETPPAAAPPPPAMTYLQTLQTVRDWVSASPEASRQVGTDSRAEAVPDAGLPQAVPTAPATVQVINPTELAISPSNRPKLEQGSSPWDTATNFTPFPASTAEPTTVISIGTIQVTVEGPPAPLAPAPVRRSESPRPPARLSRYYLRLR